MKILIIEDEAELANSIAHYLSNEQYICEFAADYHTAIQKVYAYEYDCIVLDIMLPGGSGLNVLEELKTLQKNEGVIIVSAKNALDDKILGLKLGADDYLVKPFHIAELKARIESVIRRKQFDNKNIIQWNELSVDLNSKSVSIHNVQADLTKKEFELLLFFLGNKNRVLSKATIAEHLSGDFADMFDNHDFIYAHIKNLKRKLKDYGCADYIKTVYGTGYKWQL